MLFQYLFAAARGVVLAVLVAGGVWLALRPAATCRDTSFLGCLAPFVGSLIAVPVVALGTSLGGAWLMRLPWFWLVALSGCAAMYAGGATVGRIAPGSPIWLGLAVSALAWFPTAAVLAQPGVSSALRLSAALVLVAALVVPPVVLGARQQQRRTEQFAAFGVPLAIPEVSGYHPAAPSLNRGGEGYQDSLSIVLVLDRDGGATIFASVLRPPTGLAPCDPNVGVIAETSGQCRVLGPDRWEFQGQANDVLVIRHADGLVVLTFPRGLVSASAVERATVRDVTAAELALLS